VRLTGEAVHLKRAPSRIGVQLSLRFPISIDTDIGGAPVARKETSIGTPERIAFGVTASSPRIVLPSSRPSSGRLHAESASGISSQESERRTKILS
jgi:hypothetical protein